MRNSFKKYSLPLLGLLILPLSVSSAMAAGGSDTISDAEKKIILQFAPITYPMPGVDQKAGTVQVTNNAISAKDVTEKGQASDAGYLNMIKVCEMPMTPPVAVDTSVILVGASGSRNLDLGEFWLGFRQACRNSAIQQSMQKIKSFHFKLGAMDGEPIPHTSDIPWAGAKFHKDTGELEIDWSCRMQNVADGIDKWIIDQPPF